MEREDVLKFIQKAVENVPLILLGSGSSAPFGLPSMEELGEHLICNLSPEYKGVECWDKFSENIANGQDLETALLDVTLTPGILDEIRRKTWTLINERDLQLFTKVVFNEVDIPLSKLIRKFNRPFPSGLNIITTNYDRVVEYACDLASAVVNTGFSGNYLKQYVDTFNIKNTVNLIKVHGSLDTFKDIHNMSFSIPLQHEIPVGLVPDIITPGLSKFKAVLTGTPRQLLTESDKLIREAQSFLCIGYGFNDEQIQENIVASVRKGKPIVVLTKNVSDKAASLLCNSATNYVSIQQGIAPDTTEFCINKKIEILEGTYWTIEGFMQIID